MPNAQYARIYGSLDDAENQAQGMLCLARV